jgi:hypothetical protein
MESRLTMINRFLAHFCDATRIATLNEERVKGRVGTQVIEIRERVNQYFVSYFACESILQVHIDDLEAFGVNAPLIFGLLDELGHYLTKHANTASQDFIDRWKGICFFKTRDEQVQRATVIQMATSLFFALHFIMQKLCSERTDKKLKASAGRNIVDTLLLDQMKKQKLVQVREVQPEGAPAGGSLDQLKVFFNTQEGRIANAEAAQPKTVLIAPPPPEMLSMTSQPEPAKKVVRASRPVSLRGRIVSKRLKWARYQKSIRSSSFFLPLR